jgi:hypothetical protein
MQQFKSTDELAEYLGKLEERVKAIELENSNLRAIKPKSENTDGKAIARSVARVLPQTNLLSTGFLKRAFAVWGHFFVANLIIGIIVGIAYMCFVAVMLGSAFGSLIQQTNP